MDCKFDAAGKWEDKFYGAELLPKRYHSNRRADISDRQDFKFDSVDLHAKLDEQGDSVWSKSLDLV
jgi:hypothetical protein